MSAGRRPGTPPQRPDLFSIACHQDVGGLADGVTGRATSCLSGLIGSLDKWLPAPLPPGAPDPRGGPPCEPEPTAESPNKRDDQGGDLEGRPGPKLHRGFCSGRGGRWGLWGYVSTGPCEGGAFQGKHQTWSLLASSLQLPPRTCPSVYLLGLENVFRGLDSNRGLPAIGNPNAHDSCWPAAAQPSAGARSGSTCSPKHPQSPEWGSQLWHC